MAADNFDRSNEAPIQSPWAMGPGTSSEDFDIVSNEMVKLSANSNQTWFYSGAASTDVQDSEFTIGTLVPVNVDVGPATQVQTAGAYIMVMFAPTEQAGELDSGGSYTQHTTFPITTGVEDDVLKMTIDADGNVELFVNGSSVGSFTDTTLTGGQPGGFMFYQNSSLDDFFGGDTGAANEEIEQARSLMRFQFSRIFGRVN